MSAVELACCIDSVPYIGVDETCSLPAIFCLNHSPHHNQSGLLHQMLPLQHFKRTLAEKKFKMADKIGNLTDEYSRFMENLI